jgi:hypothetical protein
MEILALSHLVFMYLERSYSCWWGIETLAGAGFLSILCLGMAVDIGFMNQFILPKPQNLSFRLSYQNEPEPSLSSIQKLRTDWAPASAGVTNI